MLVDLWMPMLVLTLTLMHGHIGSAKAKNQHCMLSATTQSTSIKLTINGRPFFFYATLTLQTYIWLVYLVRFLLNWAAVEECRTEREVVLKRLGQDEKMHASCPWNFFSIKGYSKQSGVRWWAEWAVSSIKLNKIRKVERCSFRNDVANDRELVLNSFRNGKPA